MATTITYSLAPEPLWYIVNDAGRAAGGAYMYTYRSLNHEEAKAVYQDAGGTERWTNPIIFNANGVQGPFYWKFDTAQPDELYYIEVYTGDRDNGGTLLWTINNFSGGNGGGGGGNVTTYIPIKNYINNSVFIDHIPDTTLTTVTNIVIAPSNHKGFTPALINPVISTYGAVGPDIRFLKSATVNTDSVSFPVFALADNPMGPSDSTPVDYVRYQCTTANAGEDYKSFQFPVTQKVKNLSNMIVSFQFWAKAGSGSPSVKVFTVQYFGSGEDASTEFREDQDTFILDNTWTKYTTSFTVPSVAGKSLGNAGKQTDDDALYIQLGMPLDTQCDIWFTKPSLYLGDIDPTSSFDDYDQINSVNSTPRTGDIKTSYIYWPDAAAAYPSLNGWVPMNDGSIGNVGSGATTRANQDTFQLYKTLWDGVLDAWAPVSTGRGASAIADFIANKTLTLPRALGRAMASSGTGSGLTARALGEYVGSEVITIAGMPNHNHPGSTVSVTNSGLTGSNIGGLIQGGGSTSVSVAAQGGGTLNTQGAADGNMEPTSFFLFYIKL